MPKCSLKADIDTAWNQTSPSQLHSSFMLTWCHYFYLFWRHVSFGLAQSGHYAFEIKFYQFIRTSTKYIKCGSFNSIINLARRTFFCCCYFRKSCEEQLSADLSCNDIEYYSNGIKQFIYQNIKYLIPLYSAWKKYLYV